MKRIKRPIVFCVTCGKEFTTYFAWLRRGRGKFCSKNCYNLWQKNNKKGENNPHWQGGKVKQKCLNCKKI